jgi:hypothetical protein
MNPNPLCFFFFFFFFFLHPLVDQRQVRFPIAATSIRANVDTNTCSGTLF